MSKTAVNEVIQFLSILTLTGDLILIILALCLFLSFAFKNKINLSSKILDIFRNYGLGIALIAAAVATSGSLFFSEIAKFVPCKLCWYQRIFMYPQVILLLIANIKQDYNIKKYIFT